MTDPKTVTRLLADWHAGEAQALDQLTPMVYSELHRLARQYMRGERNGHTLQTTALVNEAFAHLVDQKSPWESRSKFYAVAASQMRRILVDYARAKKSAKRGGGADPLPLDEALVVSNQPNPALLELDEALNELGRFDPCACQIIELLYFGGFTYEDAAKILGISRATLHRELTLAKAWLYNELNPQDDDT